MQQKSRRLERPSSNTCTDESNVLGSSKAHSLGSHWLRATRAVPPAAFRRGRMPPPVVCLWGRRPVLSEGACVCGGGGGRGRGKEGRGE